jgi:hypothetical protein
VCLIERSILGVIVVVIFRGYSGHASTGILVKKKPEYLAGPIVFLKDVEEFDCTHPFCTLPNKNKNPLKRPPRPPNLTQKSHDHVNRWKSLAGQHNS